MNSLLITTFLFGIAGIDPIGAALLLSGFAAGLSRAKIILFVSSVFVFTVLTGVFFSFAGSNVIANISASIPESNSSFWAFLNIVIAIIICIWLYRRSQPQPEMKPKRRLSGSAWTIALAGIGFGISAVLDPTFLAVISLTSQNGDLFTIVSMHVVWVLVSQILLFILFVAYLFGKQESIVNKAKNYWRKHRATLSNLLYAFAIICVVILLIDTLIFLWGGTYIIY